MSEPLMEIAGELEELLPAILRQIYSGEEEEPLANLPLMQLRVIRSLLKGPSSMSSLGAELRMSSSRLAHLVARLEDADLVVRSDDELDRRVRVASLTPLGMRLLLNRKRTRSEKMAAILSQMSQEQVATLLESLRSLYETSRDAERLASS